MELMSNKLAARVLAIENQAKMVHDKLLNFASRAFVIEFAGTPKAGKTTSVEAIRHFFCASQFSSACFS